MKKVLKRFSAAGSIGILFAIATASIPFAANAAVFILGNDIDISQADANRSLFAFPDVATTPSPGGPVPIPYPVMNSIETDDSTGIKTTRVTTRISIRSEKFKRAAGDEPGLIPGVVSSDNLGFVGDILQLSWNNQVHPEETATLSLLLADPATGLAIDPDYSVDVSDSQSGGFDFDLDSLPLTVFDLVLVAEQTTDQAQPRSLISLTDIRIDGVSVAARFDVAEIPLPPALILFASGFFGLVLSQRRRHRETGAATA